MPKATVDHDLIRELAQLLDETGLSEIEIEQEGLRVRVGRNAQASFVSASAHAPPPPMVGTAYLSPEPGARPYVDVGTVVKAGDTLLIIEAMKTMNSIPAPRGGKLMQILIDDGRPVEYGEPLMIIE